MMSENKHEWHVVSVDAATVPRILFTSSDPHVCQEQADTYFDTQALPGEEVFVACSHHRAVEVAKKYRGN